MYIIVGLGNHGEEYAHTRHNIGWTVLHEFIRNHRLASPVSSSRYSGEVSEGTVSMRDVGILFPLTYMNNSGTAVSKYVQGKTTDALVVVHDDIDLPFGEIKISNNRGAGGHNGVKSIVSTLHSTDFARVRIGIAQKGFFGGTKKMSGEKLSDFVLDTFSFSERKKIPYIFDKVNNILISILENGVDYAMNLYNGDNEDTKKSLT